MIKGNHLRLGLPFLITVVGGSWALQYYSQLRYDIQAERHLMTKTDAIRKLGNNKKQVTLEEEYEEYKKSVDLDNWKNVRGPRPWETDNTEYKELIERRAKESQDQWVFKK